jgi:hypothetical protein
MLNSVEVTRKALRRGLSVTTPAGLLEAIIEHVIDAIDRFAEGLAGQLDQAEERIVADEVSFDRRIIGRVRRMTVRLHRQLVVLRSLIHRFEHAVERGPKPALRLATVKLGQRLDWLDTEIVDLDPARLERIEVTPDSGAGYVVQRAAAGGPLQLADLGAGEKLKPDADLSRLAGAFARMKLEDVKPREQLDWPETGHTAVATSLDGLEVTVHLAKIDGEPWAMLDARAVEMPEADPPRAAPETEEVDIAPDQAKAPPDPEQLEARLQRWAFKLPSQLFERLTKPRGDWVEDAGTS